MRQLTLAHRTAQTRIGAAAVLQLRRVFRLLDGHDLDGSFDRWLAAVVPIIQANRAESSQLAADYLAAVKQLETGKNLTPVLADDVPLAALTTSLLVTGPISVKKASKLGVDLARAMRVAEAATSATGMRHVLNGGRDTITATIADDEHIAGWQRITGGKACEFCSMLAGRGAVYGTDSVNFEAHDGCGCTPEPVFN